MGWRVPTCTGGTGAVRRAEGLGDTAGQRFKPGRSIGTTDRVWFLSIVLVIIVVVVVVVMVVVVEVGR